MSADHFAGRTWSICRVDGSARLVPHSDTEGKRSDPEAIMFPNLHRANSLDCLSLNRTVDRNCHSPVYLGTWARTQISKGKYRFGSEVAVVQLSNVR